MKQAISTSSLISHAFFKDLFELDDIQKTSTTSDLFRNVTTIDINTKRKKSVQRARGTSNCNHTTNRRPRWTVTTYGCSHEKTILRRRITTDCSSCPNLKTLGVEILTFYHISFNPNKAPSTHELSLLNSPSTVFFASRKFEAVLLSAYPTYQDYKEDEMNKIRFLKENNLILPSTFHQHLYVRAHGTYQRV